MVFVRHGFYIMQRRKAVFFRLGKPGLSGGRGISMRHLQETSFPPEKRYRLITLVLIGLIALLLMTGCAGSRRPDLATLYRGWASSQTGRRPVVVIPGLMGSKLENPPEHQERWGRLRGLITRRVGMRLALSLDPREKTPLVPTGFVRKVGGVEVYGGICTILTEMGGYTHDTGVNPPLSATIFPFPYDWRLSNVENAAHLADLIASIKQRYHDPSLKVDIVAHSMGGLIARYYILYGGRNVLEDSPPAPDFAGAANVGKLVMLGTPNLGSASSLRALLEGNRVGLAHIPPELLSTMPSIYELLPSPSLPVLYTREGRPAPLDIYDPATWREQGWGIFDPAQKASILRRLAMSRSPADEGGGEAYLRDLQSAFDRILKRARVFHQALDAGPIPASVKTLLLGGDCIPTPGAFLAEAEQGRWKIRAKPEDAKNPPKGLDLLQLYFEPGDGDVTKASLLGVLPERTGQGADTGLPYAYSGFICEKHMSLIKNVTFQDNLLNVLLYRSASTAGAGVSSQ